MVYYDVLKLTKLLLLNVAINRYESLNATRLILANTQCNSDFATLQCSRNTLESLKWGILPHGPYSLDGTPSDYYLFSSIQSSLQD